MSYGVNESSNQRDIDDIGQAIRECRYIEIDYIRMKGKAVVKRKLKPVAIMFSEYYF